MATNWILSKRKYSLASEADAIVDLFVGLRRDAATEREHEPSITTTGSERPPCSAPGRWGRRLPRTSPTPACPTLLLDVTAEAARDGLERAQAAEAGPVLHARPRTRSIRTGGFDEDLAAVSDVRLDHRGDRRAPRRQAVAVRADRAASPRATPSSARTPRASRLRRSPRGAPTAFRRHLLGTHFFNPPRYLRLLEVIPTADTDPGVVDTIAEFADRRLGKGVVLAKDTPNFIANHIGLYGVMQIFRALATGEFTIEEIDAITGPAIGRPKSATFRTMDIAGRRRPRARGAQPCRTAREPRGSARSSRCRRSSTTMVERGWTGAKAGQGFYKKDASGEILTLDPATMEYRPQQPAAAAVARRRAIDRGRRPSGSARCSRATTRSAASSARRWPRRSTTPSASRRQIATSPTTSTGAMRWGFGWESRAVRAQAAPRSRARHAARRRESQPRRRPQERGRQPRRPRRRRARASSSIRR